MKNKFFAVLIAVFLTAAVFTSCSSAPVTTKGEALAELYAEQPLSILIMPPINNSTYVEAKEYFYTTLSVPFCDLGYYVFPPFLSMYVLERESAYDAERFINSDVSKFGEKFGADLLLFTQIDSWNKSALAGQIEVDVHYILKSTKTNQIVYEQETDCVVDKSENTQNKSYLAALIVQAISTALTDYVDVARTCNYYAINGNVPYGPYNPAYLTDTETAAPYPFVRYTVSSTK